MYYLVSEKHGKQRWVVEGHNQTDAVLTAYQSWCSAEDYQDAYEEAGSGNELAEQVLAEAFNCEEIYRAQLLEWVEQRLDGDRTIAILL